MLSGTPAGAMMTEIARQVTDRLLKMAAAGKLSGADLVGLQDHLVQEGFAIGLHQHGDDIYSWTIVLNGAGRKGSRERFEGLLQFLCAPAPPGKPPTPTPVRGRDVYQMKESVGANQDAFPNAFGAPAGRDVAPPAEVPRLAWWFEKDDLVLMEVLLDRFAVMQDPEKGKRHAELHAGQLTAILDVLEGKMPNVTSHPAYVAATAEGTDIKGFESDGLFFIDAGKDGGLFRDVLERRSVSPLSTLGIPMVDLDGPVPFGTPPVLPPGVSSPIGPLSPAGTPAPGTLPQPYAPATAPQDAAVPTAPAVPPDNTVRPSPAFVPPGPSAYGPAGQRPKANEPVVAPAQGKPRVSQPQAAVLGAAKPKVADPVKLLGLDGFRGIVGRWGFQGKALLTDVRIEAPAPPRAWWAGSISRRSTGTACRRFLAPPAPSSSIPSTPRRAIAASSR